MKHCPGCKISKEKSLFSKSRNRHDGLSAYCLSCNKKKRREWVKNNPEKHFASWLLRKYNLTLKEYNEILNKQNGMCAICNTKENLCVDHDHKTGEIRGILCQSHNKAIGLFKDNKEILQSAIKYLDKQ